jgi:uncharacterized protein (TIGR03435 family)
MRPVRTALTAPKTSILQPFGGDTIRTFVAEAPNAVNAELGNLSLGVQLKQRMLQALLANRFKLKVGHEIRELPIYALVVAKHGPKLQKAEDIGTISGVEARQGGTAQQRNRTPFHEGMLHTSLSGSVSDLAGYLPQITGRHVIDETGFTGRCRFTLYWSRDSMGSSALAGTGRVNSGATSGTQLACDSSGRSIFTALQKQLGLNLKPEKGPVEVLVIDRIEQPAPN